MDPQAGRPIVPLSTHKYLYAHANPVGYVDPSGEFVSLMDVSFASFSSSYNRSSNAKHSYDTFESIRRNLCKSADFIAAPARDLHHLLPKFMGGKEKQELFELAPDVHHALHKLLGMALVINGFPAPNQGRKAYEKMIKSSPGKRGDLNAILIDVAKFVDKACTGVPGFKPVTQPVEDVLKVADYFDF